jgi:hypothetical protein
MLQRITAALALICISIYTTNLPLVRAAHKDTEEEKSQKSNGEENKASTEQNRNQWLKQGEMLREINAKRIIDALAAAQKKCEQAKQQQETDPGAYIIALVDLAIADRDNKEPVKGSKVYSEAFSRYLLLDKNPDNEQKCRDILWRHIGLLPATEFPEKFAQLFTILEAKLGDPDKLTPAVTIAGYDQQNVAPDAHFDKKKLFKTAIDIRASIRGAEDSSLENLLDSYASECELQNDLTEAESAFRWKANLKAGKSPDSSIRSKIQLAQFYVRHGKFDQANSYWLDLEIHARPPMSGPVSQAFYELAYEYKKAGRIADADKVVSALLNVGGDQLISRLSSFVEQLVNGYLSTFNFKKAQALLIKRVKASDKCINDLFGTYARLQLSNVDFALDQRVESDKLFEQVKTKMALKGEDTTKLLADRNKMIDSLKSKVLTPTLKQTRL